MVSANWRMPYCYIITLGMTDHHSHHHHHHPGHVHPPVSAQPSILRLSVLERLAAAAGMIALMWAAVFWAMR
jgi:hypothetical protein